MEFNEDTVIELKSFLSECFNEAMNQIFNDKESIITQEIRNRYDVFKIPEDDGTGEKSPITRAIMDLEQNKELSYIDKFHLAYMMAEGLNNLYSNIKKRK